MSTDGHTLTDCLHLQGTHAGTVLFSSCYLPTRLHGVITKDHSKSSHPTYWGNVFDTTEKQLQAENHEGPEVQ